MKTPTTLFTGFLGVGKTTSILGAFAHRPPDGRWAVLVNEFGKVGIDGAILEDHDGLTVAEVAGGCICCSAGLALRTALVRLLREVRPDRLLIEPTGLAHPATVIDTLRSPGLREAVTVNAVIGLVNPRHCRSERHRESEPWQDQIRLADILLATHDDVVTDEDREAFQEIAQAQWPKKLVVDHIAHGAIDPAWLDMRPASTTERTTHVEHSDHAEAQTMSFVWPPETAFSQDTLELALQRLVRPSPHFPEGIWRLKGIFRMVGEHGRSGWYLVQATPDTISMSPIGHRRDSRVDLIVPPAPQANFDGAFAELEATRLR
ncbi:MAG: GTP-binding protein [Myxococcota bacterium]